MMKPLIMCSVAALILSLTRVAPAVAQTELHVTSGVQADGSASEQWLAMLRRRLADAEYDSASLVRRTMSVREQAWVDLILSRVPAWERQAEQVAAPYAPASAPQRTVIVTGNRGASDAFTHDARTIGFDVSALQAEYGDAVAAGNAERIDRLFRHEYAHLMQKAWLASHPYVPRSPLQEALLDIWLEGLGNHHSLSQRWRAGEMGHSIVAQETLADLEPRFIARLAALACTSPQNAAVLMANLSTGRFDRKWGALTAALWLEAEADDPFRAQQEFILAGPAGVWDLAGRHAAPETRAVLHEIREMERLCGT